MTTVTSSTKSTRGDSPPERTRHWRMPVLGGAVTVCVGALALAWPGVTLATLAALLGIAALTAGGVALFEAIAGVDGPPEYGRLGNTFAGIAGIVVGLVALSHPGFTLVALVVTAGAWLTFAGVTEIVFGRNHGRYRGSRVAIGCLDTLFGVLVLTWPGLGLSTLAALVGVSLCLRGAAAIDFGWRLRKAA